MSVHIIQCSQCGADMRDRKTCPACGWSDMVSGCVCGREGFGTSNACVYCNIDGVVAGLAERENLSGVKFDEGKPEFSLLDFPALEEVVKVLQFGAEKYGKDNWREGFIWSRPFNACLRHLFAWWGGEKLDKETGISHLAHAACNIMFLLSFEQTGEGRDDR